MSGPPAEQTCLVGDVESPIEKLAQQVFGETANPDDYVPRAATEHILKRLERAVLEDATPAALIAPPGMGKSMLLRVFARRAAATTRVAELAYGALAFEDLCEWTLGLLGEPVEGTASQALVAAAQKRDITLVIDDASSLPDETARKLGELVRGAAPKLRLAVAAPDGYAASRVIAALGEPLEELRLSSPMDAEETRTYMQRRLAASKAPPELRQRLRSGVLSRVLRLSGGVPRRVHSIVHQIVVELPSDIREQWRDEDWIGAPLDELGEAGRALDEDAA